MEAGQAANPASRARWRLAHGQHAQGGQRPHLCAERGGQSRSIPKDLAPRSTVNGYFRAGNWHGALGRTRHALYVNCREQVEGEAGPTPFVIDSQSVKNAEIGGPLSIRLASIAAS